MIQGRRDNEGRVYAIVGAPPFDAPYVAGLPMSDEGQMYIEVGTDPSLKLDIDFQNTGPLDSRITFARSSVATYLNQAGLIATAAIDVPRFEFNAAGTPLGLLIETERTNTVLHSGNIGSGGFFLMGANVGTMVDSQPAPDGSNTATLFNIISDAGTCNSGTNLPPTTTTSSVVSFFYKWGNRTALRSLVLNASNGYSVVGDLTFTPNDGKGVQYPNGWVRYSVPCSGYNVGDQLSLYPFGSSSGDYVAGDTWEAWGMQFEEALTATSYIPTTTSPVTRARDAANIEGGIISQQVGSIGLKSIYSAKYAGADARMVSIDGTGYATANSLSASIYDGTTTTSSPNASNAGEVSKGVVTYEGVEVKVCLNGDSVVKGPFDGIIGFSLKPTDPWNLGSTAISCHVQRLLYWDRVLDDQEMIELTGGSLLRVFPTDPITSALLVSIGGIPASYNMGLPFDEEGKLIGTLDVVPHPDDPYVAGVRVNPDTGVYFITASPDVHSPWSTGFSGGFGNGA